MRFYYQHLISSVLFRKFSKRNSCTRQTYSIFFLNLRVNDLSLLKYLFFPTNDHFLNMKLACTKHYYGIKLSTLN